MPQRTSIIVMSRPGIGGAQSPEVTSSPSSHAGSMSSPAASCAVRRVPGQPAQGLISVDRIVADRPFYCGKHRKHGMSLLVIVGPDGQVLWMSSAPAPSRPDQLTKAIVFLQVCEVRSRGLRKRGRRTPAADLTASPSRCRAGELRHSSRRNKSDPAIPRCRSIRAPLG